MGQRPWFHKNGLFYSIFAVVLSVHLILLASSLYKDFRIADLNQPKRTDTTRPIKIKILPQDKAHKKQIVQSEDPKTNERPDDTKFLSDKNRKFDRETKARKVDPFQASGKGKRGEEKPGKEQVKLSDLGAFKKGHNPLQAAAKQQVRPGTKSGDNQKRGISSTNDFVEEVPLGDLTALNTVEYKYYGFYHRIRQKLEQFWGRSIQEKAESLLNNKRSVSQDDNLITSLVVTLNEVGQIINIIIKGTSGVQELDDAAVESFNQAGPFPNPPKGLIRDGEVVIEWGFVIST